MPPQITQSLTELVAGLVDRRVGAEQLLRRAPGDELHYSRRDREGRSDAVEKPKPRGGRSEPSWLEDGQQGRRKQNRRKQCNRLHASRKGERQKCEQKDDPPGRRALENEDEDEHSGQEERVEDGLGHDRSGVGE